MNLGNCEVGQKLTPKLLQTLLNFTLLCIPYCYFMLSMRAHWIRPGAQMAA